MALGTAALVASGVLAACVPEPWTVDRDRVLRLDLEEYRVVPQRIRTREGRVVVLARNAGRLFHGLELVSDDDARGDRRRTYVRVRAVGPGERLAPIRIDLPPGRYRLVDPFSNNEDLGVSADLEVLPGDDPRLRDTR